jgi:N-dimethylarginine dimethylaminohydrolase
VKARVPTGSLAWGRRFLLCAPEYFTVSYEINPHMHTALRPDRDRAHSQFTGLVDALRAAGAQLAFLPAEKGLPDLVFTANAGLVDGQRFIPARFRHPERQGETPHDVAWFHTEGFRVTPLGTEEPWEGAGDVLPVGLTGDPHTRPVLVAGYRTRSAIGAHNALGELLGVPVRSVELVDSRYYHLDLVLCPLDDRRALIAPQGLDRYGIRVLSQVVPEPIWLSDDEAAAFCANSVVVGDTVVMPACTSRLDRVLHEAGFSVLVSPVGEFLKAGGGCRCLTLALDVDLSPARRVSSLR